MTLPDLPQRLAHALLESKRRKQDPPADSPRDGWPLAPALSYGRHRGPAPATARRAAVAMLWLRRQDGRWWLPLTLRPQNLRHHAGQICFPGGMIEAGETPAQAALREFQEELGHAPVDPLMCGELDPLYVYASNNLVFPVVFTARAPPTDWNPDPLEVQRVLEMPLEMLLSAAACSGQTRSRQVIRDQTLVGALRFRSVAYSLGGQMIWGATAMLLGQLARMLRGEAVGEASAAAWSPVSQPFRAPANGATKD